MYLRTLGLALLSSSLLAQVPTPDAKPAPTPAAGNQEPAKQDPDKPQPTPVDKIAELERERERLTKEIEFVRERVAKAGATLSDKIANRKLVVKSINAGTSVAAPAPVAAPRMARVLSPDEAKNVGDALLVVNTRPIHKAQVDELVDYQKAYPSSGDDQLRMHRAMLDLIRTEATHGSFLEPAKEAEQGIADLRAQAEKGADLAELAKTRSQGAGAQEGGKIEVTRNSFHGLKLEQMAFSTKEGAMSPVFKTPMGYAFLRADKFEKGESPDMDKVQATLVQLNYFGDANEMRQVQSAVATGQLDIAVRDDATLEMLPVMFRPMKAPAIDLEKAESTDGSMSEEQIKKAKLEALEKAKKLEAVKKEGEK